MDGFAGRHIVRSVAGSCVQDRGAEGVALEERFFGGRSHGMGDDDGVVVLFFKGLGGSLHFVDIGICFDGDDEFKGHGFQVPALFHQGR